MNKFRYDVGELVYVLHNHQYQHAIVTSQDLLDSDERGYDQYKIYLQVGQKTIAACDYEFIVEDR